MSTDSNWADRLAKAARVKRVTFVDAFGDEHTAHLRVPVGLEAVDYLRAVQSVFEAHSELFSLMQGLRLVPPDRSDYDTEGEYQHRLAKVEAREQSLADDEQNQLQAAAERASEVDARFVLEWLPRLCEELAGKTDDDVANVVRLSGGPNGPMVQALKDMPGNMGAADLDDLHALPF